MRDKVWEGDAVCVGGGVRVRGMVGEEVFATVEDRITVSEKVGVEVLEREAVSGMETLAVERLVGE